MAGGPRDEQSAERFLVDAEEEKLRAQALLALVDAAPGAIDELGPDRGLPLVCARLLRAMDCTTAVLSLVDARHDTLESVAGYDVSGVRTTVRGSRDLAADPTAARVIGNREPLFATPDPGPPDPARRGGAGRPDRGRLACPAARAARREHRHDRAARRPQGAALHDGRARAGPGRLRGHSPGDDRLAGLRQVSPTRPSLQPTTRTPLKVAAPGAGRPNARSSTSRSASPRASKSSTATC